jgi:hypothetical protein
MASIENWRTDVRAASLHGSAHSSCAVRSSLRPIINIFAFLPLVLLPGDKKYFIHALPIVVTISLVASRIVSMTFIPLLGYYLLHGQRGFDQGGQIRRTLPFSLVDRAMVAMLPPYRTILQGALRRPWLGGPPRVRSARRKPGACAAPRATILSPCGAQSTARRYRVGRVCGLRSDAENVRPSG